MEYLKLADEVLAGRQIDQAEACQLIHAPDHETFELLAAANKIRQAFKGNRIKLCAIINAKSGRCSENCSFCPQSAHYQAQVQTYPFISDEEVLAAAQNAETQMSATCFSIVTSGKAPKADELDKICELVKKISQKTKLNRCVSLGTLKKEELAQLKAAGLSNLHHNLETAESHFKNICTTHTYQERVATVRQAKSAGLRVCSGGIFNVGESLEQRVELAMTLRELDVDQVPLNILHPIKGTPAAKNHHPLPPLEVLRIIATYRFTLPDKDLGLFGGREYSLGSLQPLMFIAGANLTLIGDYLTTQGALPTADLEMIKQLGLEIARQ